MFDISVGNSWLKGSYLLVFWLLLVKFQPDQDIHAGESVGFGQYLRGSRQYNKKKCHYGFHMLEHFLSYVWVNYCYIIEFLWDSLFPSHAVKHLWRFPCHWLTFYFIDLCRIISEPGTLFDDKAELCLMFQWQFGNHQAVHCIPPLQSVGGVVIDSLLSTHDKFGPPIHDNIFICHKRGSRTLQYIKEHLHVIGTCKRLFFAASLLNQESSTSLNLP